MTKDSITRLATATMMTLLPFAAGAQERIHMHFTDRQTTWDAPFVADSIENISLGQSQLTLHTAQGFSIGFNEATTDSITFEDEPLTETKDSFQVFQMFITTADGNDITSREEYADCYVSIGAKGAFSNYSAEGRIRGRGNSSFLWYDKKPFRLKLNQKHKLLGMNKAKNWVLLANYRDVTDLMNAFVFEVGRWLEMPFTNHTRFVELFVNGDYRGVYQLTEQIQQGKNRVDISDEEGVLIALDVDDGPYESPNETNNFWSAVYGMPVTVKYPKDEMLTSERKEAIRQDLAALETAIRNKDFATAESLLDMTSFIHYLMIQELVYNVELSAPRSIYMHKDAGGKWVMGPLWDFDAGYDFDWSNMTTGHTYFSNYRETVMGTDPYHRNGEYSYVPQFFTNLFGCPEFVTMYKAEWNRIAGDIITRNWTVMEQYITHLSNGPMTREAQRWPVRNKKFATEVAKMRQWLTNRANYLTTLINNIPNP